MRPGEDDRLLEAPGTTTADAGNGLAFAIAEIGMWLMDINNEALSADYGVYVALAGGVNAFIGSIVALLGSRSDCVRTDLDRSSDVRERRVGSPLRSSASG